jgi:hypothetical protein
MSVGSGSWALSSTPSSAHPPVMPSAAPLANNTATPITAKTKMSRLMAPPSSRGFPRKSTLHAQLHLEGIYPPPFPRLLTDCPQLPTASRQQSGLLLRTRNVITRIQAHPPVCSVARLSHNETRSFASPPHGGFAVIAAPCGGTLVAPPVCSSSNVASRLLRYSPEKLNFGAVRTIAGADESA